MLILFIYSYRHLWASLWRHLLLPPLSFLQVSSGQTDMAAAHWKPKSLDLAPPIFLLLLILLPEARYDDILYLTSQVSLSLCVISTFLLPLNSFHSSPSGLLFISQWWVLYNTSINQVHCCSRHGNLSNTIRSKMSLYYKWRKSRKCLFVIKQWDALSCDCLANGITKLL